MVAFDVSGSSCWRRFDECTAAGIFGDRAYGTAAMIALEVMPGIVSLLAPRSDDTHGSGPGLFRYVVDRTLAGFSQFRRIGMCYERKGEHFQAFHDLAACCLVVTRLRHYELQF